MASAPQELVLIYKGNNSLIYYQAVSEYNQPVAFKVLNTNSPTTQQLIRFNNEHELTKDLTVAGARKSIAKVRLEDKPALVLEYIAGETLKQVFIAQQQSLVDFLQIAIPITQILGELHQQHIIHKDINCYNILVNMETKAVKIIDFGLASRLNLRVQNLGNSVDLAGTLAYISPEQTGRMNRAVDYRTDLYSLGVTFYELLSGHLPFESNEPLALVHAHLAQTPQPVTTLNPDIPIILSDIIMKLLAKNAEDRYQSAFGLKADLERCLAAITDLQDSENLDSLNFELGQDDYSGKFRPPEKLYGRAKEITTLITAFGQATAGNKELILIAGNPGVGKSALAAELAKVITEKRGHFINGKFDQYQQHMPYSAFSQAFSQWVDLVLTEQDTTLQKWREKILMALNSNGAVLTEVIPHLEKVIGSQPAVSKLDGRKNRNRFNLTFQNFIQAISTNEQPLVIFIDDWQWADLASLELLRIILKKDVNHQLLLIGAYRDNEVDQMHPFMITISDLIAAGKTIQTIQLDNLEEKHVQQLVQESLACSKSDSQEITRLIYEKTRGNAFFTRQFLQNMYEEGWLQFNFDTHCWAWNIVQIETQNITDNVVKFMLDKLKKLPQQTAHALQSAACIGNEFTLQTLAWISQTSEMETLTNLEGALLQGLVNPLDDYYKLANTAGQANFCFLHDRVQQAAYSQIPVSKRKAAHLEIGRLLSINTPAAELEQKIFDIAQHYNQALQLITDETERLQIAELNLHAANLAYESAAFSSAQTYLEAALALMPQDAWDKHYDQMLKMYSQLASTLFLTGNFEQLERIFQVVESQAHSIVDTAQTKLAKILSLLADGYFVKAIELSLDFIENMGVSINRNPSQEEAVAYIQETSKWLTAARLETLLELPDAPPEIGIIYEIAVATNSAIYNSNMNLCLIFVSRIARLCFEQGLAPWSPVALTTFALMLNGTLHDIPKVRLLTELSWQLYEKRYHLDDIVAPLSVGSGGFIMHHYTHLKHTLPILTEGIQKGLGAGSFEFVSHCAWWHAWHHLFLGTSLDKAEIISQQAVETCQKVQMERVKDWCLLIHQANLNLQGKNTPPWILKGEAYDADEQLALTLKIKDLAETFRICFYKAWLHYLFDQQQAAVSLFQETEAYLVYAVSLYLTPLFHFYDALANAAVYTKPTTEEKSRILERINHNLEQLEVWVHFAPMNHQHKWDLIEAEKARLEGKYWEAVTFYKKSIQGARENEFLSEEALAYELCSQFWLEQGDQELAHVYLQKAQNLYSLWGAEAKVKQLQTKHESILRHQLNQPQSISTTSEMDPNPQTPTSRQSTSQNWLDVASLLKANQTLSQTVQLTDLLTEMVKILLENAGAEKAFILYKTEKEWFIEARGEISSQTIETKMHLPLTEAGGLSSSVCNYVFHSGQTIVLANAAKEPQFATDDYLQKQAIKSVLCLPIQQQGQIKLVLYLENNLSEGAFTENHLELLQLLSGQMSISMENALLVDNLQASITKRKRAEKALRENEHRLRIALEGTTDGIWDWDPRTGKAYFSPRYYTMIGYEPNEFPQTYENWRQLLHPDDVEASEKAVQRALEDHTPFAIEFRFKAKNGDWRWILSRGKVAELDTEGKAIRVAGSHTDITDRKRAEEALEKRIVALTQPLDSTEGIAFEDLFNLSDIQHLQDLYAEAFGVAALITHLDGTPITRPSNFTTFCGKIVRNTPLGLKKCKLSDSMIGQNNPNGPNIQLCLSAGLWSAGTSISVGGHHIANWLIGQVRNKAQNEEEIMMYAREIGANETAFRNAYQKIPIMSQKKFERAAHVLFAMTEQISTSAYQNIQQARFITERRQVEAELQTSEARYRALVESQVDLISRYQPDTTLTFVNDAYCQFYGKTCQELIGKSFLSMVAPEFHEQVMDETRCFLKDPRPVGGEYLNYRQDGKPCWIHWIIQGIEDENGHVVELQATGRDITPLKQAEEEIRRLNEELEQRVIERTAQLAAANKELEAFSYSVSHDLRAPLRAINGYTRILVEDYESSLDAGGQRICDVIHTQTQWMSQLIDDLLAFSRISRTQVQTSLIDMNKLVNSVFHDLTTPIERERIKFQVGTLPSAIGDRTMIRQVWSNLLSNAIKFSAKRKHPVIEVGSRQDNSETSYFVCDNGVGFDMQYADKLFGVFQRLHSEQEFEGTGVGLAIVQRVIQRHGGEVWVEADVDKGATFYFTLPPKKK